MLIATARHHYSRLLGGGSQRVQANYSGTNLTAAVDEIVDRTYTDYTMALLRIFCFSFTAMEQQYVRVEIHSKHVTASTPFIFTTRLVDLLLAAHGQNAQYTQKPFLSALFCHKQYMQYAFRCRVHTGQLRYPGNRSSQVMAGRQHEYQYTASARVVFSKIN